VPKSRYNKWTFPVAGLVMPDPFASFNKCEIISYDVIGLVLLLQGALDIQKASLKFHDVFVL